MNYLGIDFGTTGVSAVLLNQSTGQHYPIYWQNDLGKVNSQIATRTSGEAMFRLPTITYSGPAANQVWIEPPVSSSVVVGSLASTLAKEPGIYLQNFKPYLKMAIPYYCQDRHEWEPSLQLAGEQSLSLYWVRRALQATLATLTPQNTLPHSALQVGAVGLESEALATALAQLEGVVLGCPANWGDTYQINLREAVLESKLVKEPRQVFFIEDAIATFLAGLSEFRGDAFKRGRGGEGEVFSTSSSSDSWSGSTLVINVGAITTELAIVNLPDNLQALTHEDFKLWSWAYGGYGIDQDIVWQLIYPQMSVEQQRQLGISSELELPLPGQTDQPNRDRTLSLLHGSGVGQALLKAAAYLKVILQHKEEFTLNVGVELWTVKRRDLEAKVIFPFVEQLNQELNALLIKTGFSQQGIRQVICKGGSTAFPMLNRWLEQKLPNATLMNKSELPEGTWVAAGLANLPLYPHVLNYSQQQYSDYFLLLELLRTFANTKGDFPLHLYSIKEIMQKLERQGLNTSACSDRLISLLDGNLPPGLVPSIDYGSWLSPVSQENLHYSRLSTGKIFEREGDGFYRPNREQQEYLRQYLDSLLYSTFQMFEEPLILNLGNRVV